MSTGDDKQAGAGQEQRSLLLSLLRDMFQLNQPDLDFGLYRVMHAKSDRVNHFLEKEMPQIITSTFSGAEVGKSGRTAQETSVYDHLYRFFRRYYSDGDFISRRYFTRETKDKAAPYAIPYDGREVYLHWANRDQHYIKTTSQLTDFEFDLAQSPDLPADLIQDTEVSSLPVACRIAEAQEGEHDNVKETTETKRFFVLHGQEPVRLEMHEGGGNG